MKFKNNSKKQAIEQSKGITLIALVITIIVLLILAGVSIATLTGENGLLTRAENAKTKTAEAELEEEIKLAIMGSYGQDGKIDKEKLNDNLKHIKGYEIEEEKEITKLPAVIRVKEKKILISNNGSIKILEATVAEARTAGTIFNKETIIVDSYGNTVTVPEGFKIASDSATEVAQGVVIEDARYTNTIGSQFVWIPVGTVTGKVNEVEKTAIITLGRYEFTSNSDGTVTTSDYTGDFVEENSRDTQNLLKYGNEIAEDIEAFKVSTRADRNGGYYIGRFETGLDINSKLDKTAMPDDYTAPNEKWTGWSKQDGTEAQIVCKQGLQVWNYITQNKAAELSRNMYSNTTFTSDLINSYAWDTAIVFIQEFGEESNSSTYSRTLGLSINATEPQTAGTNTLQATEKTDKQCNIFDMAGNYFEWSTETYNDSSHLYPSVCRGSVFSSNSSKRYTSYRGSGGTVDAYSYVSFRPILYL